jgi:hypothetical protein
MTGRATASDPLGSKQGREVDDNIETGQRDIAALLPPC